LAFAQIFEVPYRIVRDFFNTNDLSPLLLTPVPLFILDNHHPLGRLLFFNTYVKDEKKGILISIFSGS